MSLINLVKSLADKKHYYTIDEPNHIIICDEEGDKIFSGTFNEFMKEIENTLNLTEDPM